MENMGKKVEVLEKKLDTEIRTMKKMSRKAQLDFFKEKSEFVMTIFKQEQMYMVQEYYALKRRDDEKDRKLTR